MNNGYKENYIEQLHMFPVSGTYTEEKTSDGGPFNRAIEKGNKAIRLHSIKEKPKRKPGWQNDPKQVKQQAQEEFNPFIKHCWLLVAESHFYNGDFLTAAVTYSYITRHFTTDEELVATARIWQARCYAELEWFYEANNLIKKLNETGISYKQQKLYEQMYADYLLKNEQIENAIPHLVNSIKSEKNKRQRSRQRYLLGQLYMATGQNDLAYNTFGKVASSNPPYEIEFASRIRQTEVFPGDNYEKVLKMLRKMSKSDKNIDFLDQVYYAMGNVYMTQLDTVKAIESYAEGIEKSTMNGMEKAICQIRLGDIYFTQKDYMNAQPCFSGALSIIHKEYKDYDRVSRLSESLDELVVYHEAVHLQDSLQTLAKMPEEELLAVIDKIIEEIIEEEKRAKEEAEKEEYLASQSSMGSNFNQRNSLPQPMMPGSSDNSFYFYNPQVVAQGKTQFQNKWGKRALEDNWRRRNKKMAILQSEDEIQSMEGMEDMTEEMIAKADSLIAIQDSLASDIKSREYYLRQIPLTEDDLEASNIIIADGLFNMGMIYKDKLEDMPLSVGTFEELGGRFPENDYRLDYYYHIYLMALRYKDTALGEKYKNLLIEFFPESDYTLAVSDPDYEYNIRMMDIVQDSIYQLTYESFLVNDTAAVSRYYQEVRQKYPLSKLMPKFMFLNALTYVQADDAEGFKEALTALTEKYPTADVSELALEILRGLLRGRQLMQGNFTRMTWDIRFGVNEDGVLSAEDSARVFIDKQDIPHRMLLIFTTGSIDRNQLLYAVAAYNFMNFRVKGFDIKIEEVGSLTIMTISGFNSLKEIIDYYDLIYGQGGYATTIDEVVSFFPISDDNYDVLMHGKTLEEYMKFFIDNFGESSPQLANRWRVRVDADLQTLEEEEAREAEARAKEEAEARNRELEEELRNRETVESWNREVEKEKEEEKVEKKVVVADIPEPVITTEKVDSVKIINIVPEEEEEVERAKAKGTNIFRRLFKALKSTNEFKMLESSIQTAKELAGEDMPTDSIIEEKPLERVDGELTFEQIQELRKREAEEQAAIDAEKSLAKELSKKEADELKKQQAKEKAQLRSEREKAAKQLKKQREKELKQNQKLKERENKKKLKEREKERKQKAKEKKSGSKK